MSAEDHHRQTLAIAQAFLPDIERIAAGDVANIPRGLVQEQTAWRRSPLSSTRAEGFHRTQRLIKIHGSASKTPWSFGTARLQQGFEIMDDIEENSDTGMACFCSEYRSYSRILQTKPGKHLAGAIKLLCYS